MNTQHPSITSKSNSATENIADQDLSMDEVLLQKLHNTVLENLKNEQFSVEDLASEVALSRSHLHRKLQKLTGQSISQFIRSIRLDNALAYLKKDVGTVSEIAYKVGFGSSTYFIKCFSEHFGFSPGEVKNKVIAGFFDIETTEKVENEPKNPIPSKPVVTPLEAFHPASSESLIDEIFNELIKFKPALEKFLIVDEEEGETPDKRILAYQIIKSYPWPLAVEIRRLFSASMKEPGEVRSNQINKTVHKGLKIISYLIVCEMIRLIVDKKISLSKEEAEKIKECLTTFSDTNIYTLLSLTRPFLKVRSSELFIEELQSVLEDDFLRELSDWVSPGDNNGIETAILSEDHEQSLILFLKKLAFLAKYKLVNVGKIEVEKRKFGLPTFKHLFKILNSSDFDFKDHEELLESFSDSQAVILMKSIKDSESYLNLSPFIISTSAEDFEQSNSNQRSDIYLLEKYENHQLVYSGTEIVETQTLSGLQNYPLLVEEFETSLKLFDAS